MSPDPGRQTEGMLGRLARGVRALRPDELAHTVSVVTAEEPDQRANTFQRFLWFWSWVGRTFLRNRCHVRASALAYTTLLALVPMLAVSLSVASLVFDARSTESRAKLTSLIDGFVQSVAPALGLEDAAGPGQPAAGPEAGSEAHAKREKIADRLLNFVDRINFGTIGVTAVVGLIFVAISLLRTVEAAFNDIWTVGQGRGWFQSIVLYWAAITLGPIVFLVATTSGYLNTLDSGRSWLLQFPGGGWLLKLTALVPLALLWLTFSSFYFLTPNTRVPWRAALVGGLVAAGLWWINNKLGALYNTKVVTYSAIYGSLGAIPLFLAGLYFSWLILLFGAQTAYTFQHRKSYLQDRKAERIHHQGREFAALRFMTEVARRFVKQEPAPTATQLADLFAVPARLTAGILTTLVQAGLLSETVAPEPTYLPTRPLSQITLHDVLQALRVGNGHDLATTPDPIRAIVRSEFEAVMAAESARARTVTLQDLVGRLLSSGPSSSPMSSKVRPVT